MFSNLFKKTTSQKIDSVTAELDLCEELSQDELNNVVGGDGFGASWDNDEFAVDAASTGLGVDAASTGLGLYSTVKLQYE